MQEGRCEDEVWKDSPQIFRELLKKDVPWNWGVCVRVCVCGEGEGGVEGEGGGVEFVVLGKNFYWLCDLKLEQAMRNLAYGNQ